MRHTSRLSIVTRAAEPDVQTPAPAAESNNPARHVIPWIQDKETLQEVVAFAGPAPEVKPN
jgi:hypothetical protein